MKTYTTKQVADMLQVTQITVLNNIKRYGMVLGKEKNIRGADRMVFTENDLSELLRHRRKTELQNKAVLGGNGREKQPRHYHGSAARRIDDCEWFLIQRSDRYLRNPLIGV